MDLGDIRFRRALERVQRAPEPASVIRGLDAEEVVQALAGASLGMRVDPLLANVLATEALNRIHRARVIIQHIADGVLAVDRRGRVTTLNPAARDMTGWPGNALVGRPVHDVLHARRADGSDLPRDECAILRALARGEAAHAPDGDVFTRRDGTRFPVAFTAVPIEREGSVEGAVVVFRDRSRDVERERALAESEERFRRLFEEQPDPAFALSGEGVFTLVNAAAERVTARDASELVGSHFGGLVVERDLPRVFDEFQRVLGGVSTRFTTAITRPDGSEVALDVTGFPLRAAGRVEGAWGIAREPAAPTPG